MQLLLRNLDEILKHDPALATVVVSHVLKEMNRKFEQLAAMYVGVNVLAEKTKTDVGGESGPLHAGCMLSSY